MWLLLIIGAAAIWLLSIGADLLVEAASQIALRLGMPKVVIGATLVSLGTTTPECAVSVMAAWQGNGGLALGNAVGSVMFDTAVIFGGGCLLARLPVDRFLLSRQGWVQFGSGLLLAVVSYGLYVAYGDQAAITQPFGALFLVLLGVYLWVSVLWSRQQMRIVAEATAESLPAAPAPTEELSLDEADSLMVNLARLVGGLALVLVGSRVTIVAVTILARRLEIPEVVISATLVATGTSLPELIVAIAAIRKRHPELLIGNVIGADILNILFVTGASAVAQSLPIIDPASSDPYVFLRLHLPTMMLMLAYFRICIATSMNRGYFLRWMGVPLLIGYVLFTIVSLLTGSHIEGNLP